MKYNEIDPKKCMLMCEAFEIFRNSISTEVSKPKSYHLNTSKSYDFSPSLKVVAQKISLPHP